MATSGAAAMWGHEAQDGREVSEGTVGLGTGQDFASDRPGRSAEGGATGQALGYAAWRQA